jgi:hypothetical protein
MLDNLLAELYDLGIRVVLENNKLLVQSSKGKVAIEVLEKIKKYKPELIKYLQSKTYKVEFNKISNVESKVFYRLSSAQKRLFLLQQMDLDSTVYNIPNIIPLSKEANKEKIKEVFQLLISRHESFRTRFIVNDGEPVQCIHENVDFEIRELTVENLESALTHFVKPFDLSKAPLIRVAIVDSHDENLSLFVDVHHIISDAISSSILEKEFQMLYNEKELPTLRIQYKDYCEWQNCKEEQGRIKGQEIYWVRKFDGEIPVLNLPCDYPRPAMQSNEGATARFTLSPDETDLLKTISKQNGLTLYMSILSVFTVILSKISGQEDIIVGTAVAGRNHYDLEQVVGMFVNTLALRNEIKVDERFIDYLGRLKQNTSEAFENQDYQFENLVEKISVGRDASHNPVFDVLFNIIKQDRKSVV